MQTRPLQRPSPISPPVPRLPPCHPAQGARTSICKKKQCQSLVQPQPMPRPPPPLTLPQTTIATIGCLDPMPLLPHPLLPRTDIRCNETMTGSDAVIGCNNPMLRSDDMKRLRDLPAAIRCHDPAPCSAAHDPTRYSEEPTWSPDPNTMIRNRPSHAMTRLHDPMQRFDAATYCKYLNPEADDRIGHYSPMP